MGHATPHVACYAGSFDPPTFGHLDVIERARRLFDKLIVGVGQNPSKQLLFSDDERAALLDQLVGDIATREPDEALVEIHTYSGLTVDFARKAGATVLIRGIRNFIDLTNELQQAVTNHQLAGIETVFVGAGSDFAYTSSTLIRQVTALGSDLNVLDSLCPPLVIQALRAKKQQQPDVLDQLIRNAMGTED